MEDVLQENHRHVVFTIDEGLRDIFLWHREMLKEFMNEAVRVIQEFFERQRASIRQQLRYIGRYIRRPAIAVHRIKGYDGEFVEFAYTDKTDGQEKTETIPVEEFISRFIDIFRMIILKRFGITGYIPGEKNGSVGRKWCCGKRQQSNGS